MRDCQLKAGALLFEAHGSEDNRRRFNLALDPNTSSICKFRSSSETFARARAGAHLLAAVQTRIEGLL